MDYRELGSHSRGVQPTLDTSRMEISREKQKEEADKKSGNKRIINLKVRKASTKIKSPKQGLDSSENITMKLSRARESPYNRSDQAVVHQ